MILQSMNITLSEGNEWCEFCEKNKSCLCLDDGDYAIYFCYDCIDKIKNDKK